ncbi:MAG: acyl carrier protein [Planctomycetes bacterium]|nr:acyl carrier protein [Planctomycetota bacterium]
MPRTESELESRLRAFVRANFLFGREHSEPSDSDSLLETGVMDSTGVLEIVDFLKVTWDVDVSDHEMLPENLDSIERLAAFVRRKLTARQDRA